jgi:uncharacterized membrane protein
VEAHVARILAADDIAPSAELDIGSDAGKRATRGRLASIDILRGLVMMIMTVDHARELFSSATFDPADLSQTSPALFLTRWVTHFCAPTFVFLAGVSAFLSTRSRTAPEVSSFLLTRGLWLMFLEVAFVTPFGWAFNLDYAFTRLQVIWAIGAGMVLLAACVRLWSVRTIGVVGLVIVVGHNIFDGQNAALLSPMQGAWALIDQFQILRPLPGHVVASIYPILPWFGVLALGYGAGAIVAQERRRALLLAIGLAAIGAFVVLRLVNRYGDPTPWTLQRDILFTVLSFLNCHKYPPSLAYVLMTLGPACCFLAVADRASGRLSGVLATFGQVPLFFYLLHLPLLHTLAAVSARLRYGDAAWVFHDVMDHHAAALPPPGHGYDLWIVWAISAAAVLLLYPACRWFAGVKARHKSSILRYL